MSDNPKLNLCTKSDLSSNTEPILACCSYNLFIYLAVLINVQGNYNYFQQTCLASVKYVGMMNCWKLPPFTCEQKARYSIQNAAESTYTVSLIFSLFQRCHHISIQSKVENLKISAFLCTQVWVQLILIH